jgi:hypothetical protein
MFQKAHILPSLLLSLYTLGAVTAGAAPVKPGTHAQASGDGSVFGEVIPTELERTVTVKPSWLPLSKQLASLQDATKVSLTCAPSVPDDPLFVAAPNRTEFALLHQMRLLLTDDLWRSRWDSKNLDVSKDSSNDKHSYRLWREAVSPQERRAKMAQAAKDRLAKILALIGAGPAAWDAARQEDPELSNDIRWPMIQAPLLLAGQLSPEQMDGVLAGAPLTLSVANMTPQDQALVRQAVAAVPNNDIGMQVTNNITGETHLAFDMHHLLTSGEIVFQAQPLGDDPGTLGLSMSIFTEPAHEMGAGGHELLHPNDSDFAADEKQKIAARHQQEAAEALAAKTPGAKTVTIDVGAKPEPGEPQMAAYLRAFATQTGLTVLAHWPKDSEEPERRLPMSIVKKPAGEALDILCKTYGGEWVQDETTVRLRALPIQEPAIKKPVPSSPTATGISAPTAPLNSGPKR